MHWVRVRGTPGGVPPDTPIANPNPEPTPSLTSMKAVNHAYVLQIFAKNVNCPGFWCIVVRCLHGHAPGCKWSTHRNRDSIQVGSSMVIKGSDLYDSVHNSAVCVLRQLDDFTESPRNARRRARLIADMWRPGCEGGGLGCRRCNSNRGLEGPGGMQG